MKQHHIQKAYLKPFSSSNLVYVYEKNSTSKPYKKPIKSITTEEDFQSLGKEREQNRLIERPGALALRKLFDKNDNLNDEDVNVLLNWLALHLIRNQSRKELLFSSTKEYEQGLYIAVESELKWLSKFSIIDIYSVGIGEYFITSDNPIVEVCVKNKIFFAMPLSPSKAVLLTSDGERPIHEELSFPDSLNLMMYASCHKQIYSNRNDLPIQKFEDLAKKWNMIPIAQEMLFTEKKL
jgi:hypothetical protein